jgi:glyoxylase-like metal-dependent hydrolase (beta-lactamase superfamily II)
MTTEPVVGSGRQREGLVKNDRRRLVGCAAVLLVLEVATASGSDPAYRLEKVADGVYCAISSETAYYVTNSAIVIGEEAVLVVDSGASPGGARRLIEAVRTVSDRPIRYLVDTHFHFDHAFGNAAFGPDTVVIAHEATRALLGPEALRGRTFRGFADGIPARVEQLRQQASTETAPEKRQEIKAQAASLEAYGQELATLALRAPAVGFSERAVIELGNREVQLVFPGRGHTAGDALVFLPRERVLCSGDFFNGYIGYMGDAYVDEWADSLDRLAELDFETVVPGHGAPFKGKARIAMVQACLRDLWRQAVDVRRAGVPADQAAPRIDLRVHAAHFPPLAEPGFNPTAVRRIYEVLDEREARR